MPPVVADLLALLDLEAIEDDIFAGSSPATSQQRVFGGQVLAQALVACGRTTPPDRLPHSLHAYFLRLGDPSVPIAYVVEHMRDGRSFSTRRAVARQHGRPIFALTASFQVHEEGLEHQVSMPSVPPPDELPLLSEVAKQYREAWPVPPTDWAALEMRPVYGPLVDGSKVSVEEARAQMWLRTAGPMPDDPLLHAAVLAYASDLTLLATAGLPHGVRLSDPRLFPASLDHAMWFHRPFRADEWLLHDETSPSASNARGFAEGKIFSAGGQLVASTVQEGLLRFKDE